MIQYIWAAYCPVQGPTIPWVRDVRLVDGVAKDLEPFQRAAPEQQPDSVDENRN